MCSLSPADIRVHPHCRGNGAQSALHLASFSLTPVLRGGRQSVSDASLGSLGSLGSRPTRDARATDVKGGVIGRAIECRVAQKGSLTRREIRFRSDLCLT